MVKLLIKLVDWFIASRNSPAVSKDDFADVIDNILAGTNQKGDGNIIIHERDGWSYYATRRPIKRYYRRG